MVAVAVAVRVRARVRVTVTVAVAVAVTLRQVVPLHVMPRHIIVISRHATLRHATPPCRATSCHLSNYLVAGFGAFSWPNLTDQVRAKAKEGLHGLAIKPGG